jgi:hypothetical protein
LEEPEQEKPQFAKPPLRPAAPAHLVATETTAAKPSSRFERPAELRGASNEPSRLAALPRGAAVLPPKAAAPELQGDGAPVEKDSDPEPRRPRRRLLVGGAFIAILLAAGAPFMIMRSGSSVTTPIVTADQTAAKIELAAVPTAHREQSKLVSDRVEGADGADKIKPVTPASDGIAASPASQGEGKSPLSQVDAGIPPSDAGAELPPSPPVDPVANVDSNGASAKTEVGSVNHGSGLPIPAVADPSAIKNGDDKPAADASAGAAPMAVAAPEPGDVPASDAARGGASASDGGEPAPRMPLSGAKADAADPVAEASPAKTEVDPGKGLPIPVNADPSAIKGADDKLAVDASAAAAPAGAAPTPGDVPISDTAGDASASDSGGPSLEDASAAPAAPVVVPLPPPRPADRAVASRSDGAVGAKKAGEPLPSPPAVASSGGAFVQISAQKSENAAKSTYHDLQVKFPSILGKLDPNIQRADLGGKGIYYRVRIGPFASAEAQKICGTYQAAGGSCVIARQ